MKHFRQKNKQGAILLEALLAVMILAVALTAIVQAMMSGLRAAVTSVEYLRAASLLESVMVEKFLAKAEGVKSQSRTAFEAPYDRYQYAVEMSDENDPLYKDLKLRRLECSVAWPAGKGTRTLAAALWMPGTASP